MTQREYKLIMALLILCCLNALGWTMWAITANQLLTLQRQMDK